MEYHSETGSGVSAHLVHQKTRSLWAMMGDGGVSLRTGILRNSTKGVAAHGILRNSGGGVFAHLVR